MSFYAHTDRRFKGMELRVGLFAVVSLLGGAALLAYVVNRSDFFSPTSAIYFYVKSGEGIKEGMPVKLSGFSIGSVKKQDLTDMSAVEKAHSAGLKGLAVKVTLDIKTRYMDWIPNDSKAFLRKENVIGDQIIEIIPGASPVIMKAKEHIIFAKEKTLNDYFADITEEVKKVQEQAGETIDYVNDPKGEIKKALDNFHKFTVGLVETREKITHAFVTMDSTLGTVNEQVLDLSLKANKAVEDLNMALATTNTSLPRTFGKIDESLEAINRLVEEMQKLVTVMGRDLPEMAAAGMDVTQDAGAVMDSLKNTWPISRNIKPAQGAPMEMESHEPR
ncbi:MAG: MlaD family protein [Nitrospinota bacterium]|nr:MlaD family protein [Nitrospinota bacterium]